MVASSNLLVTLDELKKVVFQLGALKSPRPNGMLGIFYHYCWHIVGDDLSNAVLSPFQNGHMSEKLNHTYWNLIPKVPHPKTIEQFRPIGLCNFSYKVIVRIITNHMRAILHSIIDDSQSAFVPKRLIIDNILLAHELMI